MKIRIFTILFFTTILHAGQPLPEGGTRLIKSEWFTAPGLFNPGRVDGRPLAKAEVVDVAHPAFNRAMRVEVLNPGGLFYSSAVNIYSTQGVQKGDSVIVQLYMRSIRNEDESAVCRATVFVQGPVPGYKKYLLREITAGSEWTLYQLPFTVSDARAAGKLSLHIGAGGGDKLQTWEIGGVTFLNYGKKVKVEDLPVTRATYEGRAADAPWRQAAAARIEKFRKGDFEILVVDSKGAPVPDAELSVTFLRHAYHFGSVINAGVLMGDSEDSEQYRETLLELFNQSGTENDLKWPPWEQEWGRHYSQEQTLRALRWLKAHDYYVRGHVMVWPAKKHVPQSLGPLIDQKDPVVKQRALDHIKDISLKTADVLDEWDVVNEPYNNHDLMDAFGDEIMVDWFKAARSYLPDHKLYLNDFGILSGGGRDTSHQRHYEKTIRYLIDRGAPITGMGMQGHFGETPTSIPRVYEVLDHFHTTFPDLDIRVTELDVNSSDLELQADYIRDFLTIVFSHPATVGVQCWGFWEGLHWRKRAAMVTLDWQLKPSGRAWKHLTRDLWWNDFNGKTDAQGRFSDRGFYGRYQLKVSVNGKEQVQEFDLRKTEAGKQILKVELSSE